MSTRDTQRHPVILHSQHTTYTCVYIRTQHVHVCSYTTCTYMYVHTQQVHVCSYTTCTYNHTVYLTLHQYLATHGTVQSNTVYEVCQLQAPLHSQLAPHAGVFNCTQITHGNPRRTTANAVVICVKGPIKSGLYRGGVCTEVKIK